MFHKSSLFSNVENSVGLSESVFRRNLLQPIIVSKSFVKTLSCILRNNKLAEVG